MPTGKWTGMQLKYDQETSHGASEIDQQRWNEQIDKDLKDLGVK